MVKIILKPKPPRAPAYVWIDPYEWRLSFPLLFESEAHAKAAFGVIAHVEWPAIPDKNGFYQGPSEDFSIVKEK